MFFAKLQMIWLVITNVKGKFHSKFKHTTIFVSLQKLWRCFISFLSASILLFAGFSENKFKRGTSSLQWEFNNFGLRIFSRHFRKITIYFFSCYLLVSLFGGGGALYSDQASLFQQLVIWQIHQVVDVHVCKIIAYFKMEILFVNSFLFQTQKFFLLHNKATQWKHYIE